MGKYFPDEGALGRWPTYAVALLPVLFLIVALLYSASCAPWGRQVDPESAYTMNGIAWALDGLMRKNDHPGTTTILLVGLIAKTWAFISSSDVVELGLKNFDRLIYISRTIEILILAGTLLFSGVIIRNATHSAFSAILFQIAPFVHPEVLRYEIIVIPESLMVSSAILGIALAIKAALDENPPSVALGVISGLLFSIGLSSKYLHLPLAILAVCFLRNPRAFMAAVASGVLGFAIFNRIFNPLVFSSGFHWLLSLATHKGTYGSGEPGFIDFDQFLPNLTKIITAAPIVTAVFVGGALAALAQITRTRRFTDPISVTLLAAFLAFVAQLVATSKHFALHYMLASWVLTGGVVVLTVIEIRRLFPSVSTRLVACVVAPICGLLILVPLIEVRSDVLDLMAFDNIGATLSRAVLEAAPSCANVSAMFVRAPEDDMTFGAITTLGSVEMEQRFGKAYQRVSKVPLLNHDSYDSAGLRKNFSPISYRQLAAEYPCLVVRTFRQLDAETSLGLLDLNPDYCRVENINVYTVGVACKKIQDAYAGLNISHAASLSR